MPYLQYVFILLQIAIITLTKDQIPTNMAEILSRT